TRSNRDWSSDVCSSDLRVTLSPRNANTMWILHFLYHLKRTGTAGFVMATGELSNGETARRDVRQALVDGDYVDCIVQLSGQLFEIRRAACRERVRVEVR